MLCAIKKTQSRSAFLKSLFPLLAFLLFAACERPSKVEANKINADENIETVVVLRTNRGDITVRFFPETSPEHVKNFVAHSQSGFYAQTLFHRIIPGFMIQGGDPNTKDDDPNNDGMGGYSYQGEGTKLLAEFNDIPHTRGILSMARSRNVDSAGSQFFIMHQNFPQLNGQYTVFGEVIHGIEVVDLIVNTPRDKKDRPDQDQRIEQTIVQKWSTADIEKSKTAMWEANPIVEALSSVTEE